MTYDFDHHFEGSREREASQLSEGQIAVRAANVLFGAVRKMVADREIDPNKLMSVVSDIAFDISDVGNPRMGVGYFLQQSGRAEDVIDYIEKVAIGRQVHG